MTISAHGVNGFTLQDFNLGQELGRGEGGAVRLAFHRPSNQNFALKEISIGSQATRHQLWKELCTHQECGNMSNIVTLHDFFYSEGRVYLVLELMDWGSLDTLLKLQATSMTSRTMDEGVLSVITRSITVALAFLHNQRNLIHRDLKPGNVVMNEQGVVKLSDFGVSRVLDNEAKGSSWVGTASYMSPERLLGCQYSHKADIWSLGILILECALGRHPYLSADGGQTVVFELMQRVVSEPAPIPEGGSLSPELVDFVRNCLIKDENSRWSAAQLLQHPYIQRHWAKSEPYVAKWLAQWQNPSQDASGSDFQFLQDVAITDPMSTSME
mmetsp:Transcript_15329/g.23865  ORF Transcript_15329/g.23865 Transcript_15329/m.23865 type:complete len:327 (-) Transcript_15329:49-1029(-)